MMQLDGRFFCSICSESEGNVEATVIQTRMNTSQQDKITRWNHIDRCKKKLQIGILLTKDSQAKGRKGETTVLQNFAHPSQQKFFELLGTRELQIVLCSLFHIFTHTPVGIPTVYVQLEFQLCPYCNVTLNPFWVHNWFVNSCRLRVPLQKGRPCIQRIIPPSQGLQNIQFTSAGVLGHTTPRPDASNAEDEPGLVEEGARSPSPILSILRLNLQSATSTTPYAAHFRLLVQTPCHHVWYHLWYHTWYHLWYHTRTFVICALISYTQDTDIIHDIIHNII
jgi:hypothetical protein